MVRHHGIPTKGLESTVSKGWRFRTHHFSMNSYNGSMNCKAVSTHPTVDRRTAIARIWWIYRVDRNFRIFKAKVAIHNTPLSFQFFSLCTCKNDYTAYTWIHTQYMYCICMYVCKYIHIHIWYIMYVSIYMSPSLYLRTHRTCRHGRVVFSVPHDDLQCVLCYVPLLGSWGEFASVQPETSQHPRILELVRKRTSNTMATGLQSGYFLIIFRK